MYLTKSCSNQINMAGISEQPCINTYIHWLDPLYIKCEKRGIIYEPI